MALGLTIFGTGSVMSAFAGSATMLIATPFADPRVAALYDPLDPDRRDLDIHPEIVDEFGAAPVVDMGCGTGIFACLLAQRGKHVVGVD